MSLFGVLTSMSTRRNVEGNSEGKTIHISYKRQCEDIFHFLPYFLLDCGPYFLAAREALSMM